MYLYPVQISWGEYNTFTFTVRMFLLRIGLGHMRTSTKVCIEDEWKETGVVYDTLGED